MCTQVHVCTACKVQESCRCFACIPARFKSFLMSATHMCLSTCLVSLHRFSVSLYQEELLLSNKVILIPMCPPPSQTLPFSLSAKSIYLSVGLARLSSGLICLFVSVPRASAVCRVACKVLTQTRPPLRPVKPPTFSVTPVPAAAADDRGLRCKLTDHKLNKCVDE